MTKGLIRHYGRGHLRFITFSCYRRLPLLRAVRARNVFVKILDEVRDRYGFALVGYVVMPEHILTGMLGRQGIQLKIAKHQHTYYQDHAMLLWKSGFPGEKRMQTDLSKNHNGTNVKNSLETASQNSISFSIKCRYFVVLGYEPINAL